ncbi:hypothetical protein DY000_02034494 [Brassica cretica]|uniref:Neprosin PEP catalytic domain-containing protein n=1 Tax=Brassica cretica TaxID=69181 RepID=A0ABQ7DIN8_BRACR|nr:hypothetical protein DY000_02034494 [Brassica cretica]
MFTMYLFSSFSLIVILFTSLIFISISSLQTPKHYVVYMGSSIEADVHNSEAYYLQMLDTLLPREESERRKGVHHYKHAFRGFSAMLTEEEAAALSGTPYFLAALINDSAGVIATNTAAIQLANARDPQRPNAASRRRSQIWLENGPPGELNSIQVGWAVHPRVYGDSATRFTIYWTADGYKTTGCYNTNCPGFIIVTRKPSIGSIFKLSSVYGGDKTVIFTPHVYQASFQKNIYVLTVFFFASIFMLDVFIPGWALKVDDEMIGYWPGELFTHLKNGASRVRFGGNTYISPDGISPPMGNGHFPLKDYQRSSSFLHVKLTNHRYQTIEAKTILRNADSRCFRLMDRRYTKENGKSFSYGGAGGSRCGI